MFLELEKKSLLLIGMVAFVFTNCSAQNSVSLNKKSLNAINRNLTTDSKNEVDVVYLDAKPGDGMAILEDTEFKTGTIRLDIQGEDNPGKSFVGIAFNVQNDSTYESIYFRPFNFKSPNKDRRAHSVQYVYHPDYPWKRLRDEQKGKFEAEYAEAPSPNDWFNIAVTIQDNKVIVKDGNSENVLLEVQRLAEPSSDKIAFWVGNNSQGSFRNLQVSR